MTHTPRPRATALPFLLLGLMAGSASPTLAKPAAKPPAPAAPPQADAGDLPVVEGGRATGQKTAEAARHDGLTVLDLSDDWLPSIFSETPDKPEPLRPFLIDLANGKFRSGGKYSRAREDRYFEAFGIPPSLNLLRRRIAERRRHACHARVKDGAPLNQYVSAAFDAWDQLIAPQYEKMAEGNRQRIKRVHLINRQRAK